MQIKTEEISLEELNNNVVEYVLKSPHNTNPAILRQMLNSRGVSAPAKSTIIFEISSDDDLGDEINDKNYYLANVITNETVTPEELAKITLSGTGFIAWASVGGGFDIKGQTYALSQILGFSISEGGIGITSLQPNFDSVPELTVSLIQDIDYKQAYIEALTREIFNA